MDSIKVRLPNRKGDISWEYIAVIILCLIVLLVLLLFSGFMKEKVIEGLNYLSSSVFGR